MGGWMDGLAGSIEIFSHCFIVQFIHSSYNAATMPSGFYYAKCAVRRLPCPIGLKFTFDFEIEVH